MDMHAIGNGEEEAPPDNHDDSESDSLNAPTLRLGDPSDSEEEMPPLVAASELGETDREDEVESGGDEKEEEQALEDVVMEQEEGKGSQSELEEGEEENPKEEDEVYEDGSPHTEITSYFDSPTEANHTQPVDVIDMCVDLMTHFKNTDPIVLRSLSIIFHKRSSTAQLRNYVFVCSFLTLYILYSMITQIPGGPGTGT